jgi:hypothetical protein
VTTTLGSTVAGGWVVASAVSGLAEAAANTAGFDLLSWLSVRAFFRAREVSGF